MKRKVLLINEGFSSNLGDQAIKDSLSKFFEDRDYEVDFAYYSNPKITQLPDTYYRNLDGSGKVGNITQEIGRKGLVKFIILIKNYIDYYLWILKNKKYIKSKLSSDNYNIIAIGGGQLINTTNKIVPSYFSAALKLWVKYSSEKINKPKIYLIAVGAASAFNYGERKNYGYALKKAEKIWVRDLHSQNILANIFKVESELIPDIAFYTDSSYDRLLNTDKKVCLFGIYSYREFAIKFNVNSLDLRSYYETWSSKLLNLINDGYKIELFYTTVTDATETVSFNNYIYETYGLKLDIRAVTNLEELYDLYRSSDKVYSARMHALLLAKKFGCEVEAYIISQKLQSFNDEYIVPQKETSFYKKRIEDSLEKYI